MATWSEFKIILRRRLNEPTRGKEQDEFLDTIKLVAEWVKTQR